MSNHNICFYGEIKLSSNTHIICFCQVQKHNSYLHNFLNFFITSGINTGFPDVTSNSTKLDICWHIVSSKLSPNVGFGNLFDDDIIIQLGFP